MSGEMVISYLDHEKELLRIISNRVPSVGEGIDIKTKRMKKHKHFKIIKVDHIVTEGEWDDDRYRVLLK